MIMMPLAWSASILHSSLWSEIAIDATHAVALKPIWKLQQLYKNRKILHMINSTVADNIVLPSAFQKERRRQSCQRHPK